MAQPWRDYSTTITPLLAFQPLRMNNLTSLLYDLKVLLLVNVIRDCIYDSPLSPVPYRAHDLWVHLASGCTFLREGLAILIRRASPKREPFSPWLSKEKKSLFISGIILFTRYKVVVAPKSKSIHWYSILIVCLYSI